MGATQHHVAVIVSEMGTPYKAENSAEHLGNSAILIDRTSDMPGTFAASSLVARLSRTGNETE